MHLLLCSFLLFLLRLSSVLMYIYDFHSLIAFLNKLVRLNTYFSSISMLRCHRWSPAIWAVFAHLIDSYNSKSCMLLWPSYYSCPRINLGALAWSWIHMNAQIYRKSVILMLLPFSYTFLRITCQFNIAVD